MQKIIKTALRRENRAIIGKNLLNGITPTIVSLGDNTVEYEQHKNNDKAVIHKLTDLNDALHLDFINLPFALYYDLGAVQTANRLLVSGYNENWVYTIRKFQIYLSKTEEDLFNDENLLCTEFYDKSENVGRYTVGDWIYNIENLEFRYFGIKALEGCKADDIFRLKSLAIFKDETDCKYLYIEKAYPENLIKGKKLECVGNYSGDALSLTDGIAFDGGVTFIDGAIIIDNSENRINRVDLVGANLVTAKVFSSNRKDDILNKTISSKFNTDECIYGRNIISVIFDTADKFIAIKPNTASVVEEIVALSNNYNVSIRTNEIINENFIGMGGNCIPTEFSYDSIDLGYNEAYFELQKRRLKQLSPHICRVFLQHDWFIKGEYEYNNSVYDFNTPEFVSVKKVIKALKDAGSEVLLNLGWKLPETHKFIMFPECAERNLNNSAPYNLSLFAKANTAAIKELYENEKLDNIKYITFFNEPNIKGDTKGDFAAPFKGRDKLKYWLDMLAETKAELAKAGLKDKFGYWGTEHAGVEDNHIVNCSKLLEEIDPDALDAHSVHIYDTKYDELYNLLINEVKPSASNKPIFLGEFSNSATANISYDYNHIETALSIANSGNLGGCLWILSGAHLPNPMFWIHNGGKPGDGDIGTSHWQFLPNDRNLDGVGESFYELSLLNTYIPIHAKVMAFSFASDYNDIRIAAFKKDDNYSVVVESKQSANTRNIKIDFDCKISKKFYKYTYSRPNKKDANMIVPRLCGEIYVYNSIDDTVCEEYSVTVYSTIPPKPQVIIDKPCVYIEAGSSVKLNAEAIDSVDTEILWSLGECTTFGAKISENGVFTMPPQAKLGDVCSVKASLKNGAYGVAIIKIK